MAHLPLSEAPLGVLKRWRPLYGVWVWAVILCEECMDRVEDGCLEDGASQRVA